MKGLVFIFVCLHASFVLAVPKKKQVDPKVYKDVVFQTEVERYLLPETNSLVELDVAKAFYPEVIRQKRNADPFGKPEGSSKRRRRRRRKKPVADEAPVESKQSLPVDSQLFGRPPLDNILEPSKLRRSRRPSKEREPIIQEPPVLSEVGDNPNDGLLRVKKLQSEYINADLMQTNKLKADRIKADTIKARDVIVTSRKRKRPSRSEFIEPEPLFQRIGSQRINALDSRMPMTEPGLFLPSATGTESPYFYEEPVAVRTKDVQRTRRLRPSASDRYVRKERFQDSFFQEPFGNAAVNDPFPPPVKEQREPMPEFSSAKVLRKIPTLSEFIEEPYIRARKPSPFENRRDVFQSTRSRSIFAPEFHLSDSLSTKPRRRSDYVEKTSKTYSTNVDPWFF